MRGRVKTAIIGGGLTGLSAAFHLRQAGKEFLLFEKEEELGGLCKSFKVNKFSFDYTGHYLHFKTAYGKKLVQTLLKRNLLFKKRKAGVYIGPKDNYIPYPFQANYRFLENKNIVRECKQGFENRKQKAVATCLTFKEWVLASFGEGIAKHFMLPYNEKLYGTGAAKMLPSGPATYVPDISRKKAAYGYNSVFYYPKDEGIGALIKALLAKTFDRCLRNAAITAIDPKTGTIIYGARKVSGFSKIISTMPLPELVPLIKGVPGSVLDAAKKLKYVSVFALNLGTGRLLPNKYHWLYFSSKDAVFYRVGFYSNVSKKLCPPWTSSLYAEVSIKKGEKFNAVVLAKRIKKDLVKYGIIKKYDSILAEQSLFMKYAYVVFDKEYYKNMAIINKYLASQGIISTGRYGAWNYSAMEDALLFGKTAAEQSIFPKSNVTRDK